MNRVVAGMLLFPWRKGESNDNAVTAQSLRALRQHIDSRGPEELLREALVFIADHLEAGHGIELNAWAVEEMKRPHVVLDTDSADPGYKIGLEYHDLGPTWNGWESPVVTAAQMREFIRRWRDNDPNGEWDGELTERPASDVVGTIVRSDIGWPNPHELVFKSEVRDEDVWTQVGTTTSGERLYRIDGWTFIKEED